MHAAPICALSNQLPSVSDVSSASMKNSTLYVATLHLQCGRRRTRGCLLLASWAIQYPFPWRGYCFPPFFFPYCFSCIVRLLLLLLLLLLALYCALDVSRSDLLAAFRSNAKSQNENPSRLSRRIHLCCNHDALSFLVCAISIPRPRRRRRRRQKVRSSRSSRMKAAACDSSFARWLSTCGHGVSFVSSRVTTKERGRRRTWDSLV
jgi:hypothetical protein